MSGNVYPTPTLQWGTLLQDPTTSMQAATREYVDAKVGGIPEAPTDGRTYGRDGATTSWVPVSAAGATVSSFNARTGAVTLTLADITGAGGAPLASPSFTGPVSVSGYVAGAHTPPTTPVGGALLGTDVSVYGSGAVAFNSYTDGATNWFHYGTGPAAAIEQNNGVLTFVSTSAATASGAAGALLGWSATMALDASGNMNLVGSLTAAGSTMTGPLMLTATGGTTPRSVQDQFGDIVDVKDFGAKGDGTTVDTAAFTAAAATGKTVLVTPGTYIIGPITISQSMIGFGMGSSILRRASGGNATSDVLITQNAASDAVIRDLTIDGANGCVFGIYLQQGNTQQTGLRFERLEVTNIGNTSSTASPLPNGIFVQLDDSRPTSKQAIVVADCYIHDIYGCGISIGGIGCIVTHNTIINMGSAGISTDILTDGVISDNAINKVGQVAAMSADGITGYGHLNLRVLISNNTVENSADNGIHFGGSNIQIVGNKVYNVNGAHGIQLACENNPSNPGNPYPGQNAIVANNEIDTVTMSGIFVNYFSRVVVIGNTASNITQMGVALFNSSDSIVADNVIWTTGGNGVYSSASLNLQVHNNRINGTSNRAIWDAGGSTNMQVNDNIITSESVTSNWDRTLQPLGSSSVIATGPLIANNSIVLNNATSNLISYNTAGIGAPTFTTRSAGTKIVIYPQVSSTSVDNAIGLAGNNFWSSIPNNATSNVFSWYGGTTQVAYLDGVGNFYAVNNVWCPGGFTVTASGTYPFQAVVASGNQQLQFQGPNYAISCNGATGNLSFLVGSATPVATVSPTGISVTGTLASSGALTVSAGGINVTGASTISGGTSFTGGANFGSTFAPSATNFANQIALYGSTYGITVTSNAVNYVAPSAGSHTFYQGTTVGINLGAVTTITGNLSLTPGQPTVPAQVFSGGGVNNVLVGGTPGNGVLATTATAGFPMIPSAAGTPTGAPINGTKACALVYNTSSHTLNLYDPVAAGWYHIALTAGAA